MACRFHNHHTHRPRPFSGERTNNEVAENLIIETFQKGLDLLGKLIIFTRNAQHARCADDPDSSRRRTVVIGKAALNAVARTNKLLGSPTGCSEHEDQKSEFPHTATPLLLYSNRKTDPTKIQLMSEGSHRTCVFICVLDGLRFSSLWINIRKIQTVAIAAAKCLKVCPLRTFVAA